MGVLTEKGHLIAMCVNNLILVVEASPEFDVDRGIEEVVQVVFVN